MFHYWVSYSYSNKSACNLGALFIELETPIEYESDAHAARQKVREILKVSNFDALSILHWVELKGPTRPI